MKPFNFFFAVVSVLLLALLGFAGYAALQYHDLYVTASHSLQQATGSNQTATFYGTIKSFDSTSGILEFDRLSPYEPGATVTSRVYINPNAYVGRQTFTKASGASTGLFEITDVSNAKAAALASGVHIKVTILPAQPVNIATYLLVGDPL